jgi:NitT/TauT family transport system substrate-binding protein
MKRVVAASVAMLLTGMSAAHAAAPPEQLRLWRKGIVSAKADAGFAYMAALKGFGEKHGLKIQITQFTGDAVMLRAIIAGELDSYDGSPGAPMVAFSRGADLKLTGCQWPVLTYGIFARANVATPADLRGKRMAISAPGAMPDLLARAVLGQNNIPVASVRFAPMGNDADRFQALMNGVVDAAPVSTEMTPLAAARNLKLLVHGQDAMPNYLRLCTYMGARTVTTNKETAAHYLAAEMQALRYALGHRDEEIALTRAVTNAAADDPRPAFIFDEVVRRSAIDPSMSIPLDKLRWMQELLVRTNDLQRPVLPRFVDASVRERALQLAR